MAHASLCLCHVVIRSQAVLLHEQGGTPFLCLLAVLVSGGVPAFLKVVPQGCFLCHCLLLWFQGLGAFKDMALAFPEEEWRQVTPAQIDCFGEYVEPQACTVSPGKTLSTP